MTLAQKIAGKPDVTSISLLAKFASVVFLGLCIGMTARSLYFLKGGARANGKVVAIEYRTGGSYPVYAFVDSQGLLHTIHSNVGSDPPSYQTGDAVKVLYQPAHADTAIIEDFWNIWGFAIGFGVAGLMTLALGIFLQRIVLHKI